MRLKEVNGKLYEVISHGGCQHCAFAGLHKDEDPCFSCDFPGENSYKLHDTEQYETKHIDWSQCDPLVTFFLKQGKALQHKGEQVVWCASQEECDFDKKPARKVVKQKKELIQTLLDEGYLPNSQGHWNGCIPTFICCMFKYCGKEPSDKYKWRDNWLEEKKNET